MKFYSILTLIILSALFNFNINCASWNQAALEAMQKKGAPIPGQGNLVTHRCMLNTAIKGQHQTHIMMINVIDGKIDSGFFILASPPKPAEPFEVDSKDLAAVRALIRQHKKKEKNDQQVLEEFSKLGYPPAKAMDIQ